MWKLLVGTVAIGSVTYAIMKYFAGGVCCCPGRLDGLVIIVTGANSGIGKALCKELAKRGATLVLACRNVEAGLKVKQELLSRKNTKTQIYVKRLDLNSFESIVNFGIDIDKNFEKIYALVNNAGVFYHNQELTVDKFDVTYQTNYLGPFMLGHCLLKVLKRSEHARIVNVTSEAHRIVTKHDVLDLARSQTEPRSHFKAYGASKLALILFTREFAKILKNTNVIVNSVNPGNTETNIYRSFPPLANPWLYALQYPIRLLVVKSPQQGAQTLLHALLTTNHSTGQYYTDCKLSLPSRLALQDDFAEEYYNLTSLLIDHKFSNRPRF